MLARRLLTDPNRRRGYGLLEGMTGLIFDVMVVLLSFYLLCRIQH